MVEEWEARCPSPESQTGSPSAVSWHLRCLQQRRVGKRSPLFACLLLAGDSCLPPLPVSWLALLHLLRWATPSWTQVMISGEGGAGCGWLGCSGCPGQGSVPRKAELWAGDAPGDVSRGLGGERVALATLVASWREPPSTPLVFSGLRGPGVAKGLFMVTIMRAGPCGSVLYRLSHMATPRVRSWYPRLQLREPGSHEVRAVPSPGPRRLSEMELG